MALVHPVEALEDPLLLVLGNAYARILHPDQGPALAAGRFYGNAAAGMVVFDGIVGQVVDDLVEGLPLSPDPAVGAALDQFHPVGPGLFLQVAQDLGRQIVHVDDLVRIAADALVQPGEPDDVVDQSDHPPGLPVDLFGEADGIRGLYQPVLHDLRIARNGGQRGLELMGDVGGKLHPHLSHRFLFPVLPVDPLKEGRQLLIDIVL